MQCQAFILCANEATTMLPHPLIDSVPCCQSCKDKMDSIASQTSSGMKEFKIKLDNGDTFEGIIEREKGLKWTQKIKQG